MSKTKAIVYALLAAVFYAINVPVSKLLLVHIGPTTMAALLYPGAGIGMSVLSVADKSDKGEKLDRHPHQGVRAFPLHHYMKLSIG